MSNSLNLRNLLREREREREASSIEEGKERGGGKARGNWGLDSKG